MRAARPRRTRRGPRQPKGLRISLQGPCTTQELRQLLDDAVSRLEDLGVIHADSVNLYLAPLDEHGARVTPVRDGYAVRHINLESPARPRPHLCHRWCIGECTCAPQRR
jgi:hypothetical protein